MSLSLRRYNESPKNQSSFLLTNKYTHSQQKLNPLSNSASISKNPQTLIRLPQLSRSSMRKSFSTFQSDRNTKFKLTTLEDKLEQIQSHIHLTRQQTKESFEFARMLRKNFVEKDLISIHKDLRQQITGLQNLINCTKNDNKLRSNDLRDDCNQLWNITQSLKQQVYTLRMRVEDVQGTMGYKN